MKKSLFFSLAVLLSLVSLHSCKVENESTGLKYPVTTKSDQVDDYHGTQVADPYRWLEDQEDPKLREWIDAQNEVTFGYLDQIPFRKQLQERLEKIWNYPKYGTPFKRGSNYFYYKNDGLQNQSVLYRMKSMDDEGSLFLDPNKFSEDGTTSLTTFSVSKDGNTVCYGTSAGGSDWNEYFVMDIESGEKKSDHLKWIKFSGASWKDNGFYYGRFAEPVEGQELSSQNENKKIYYHTLGTDQSEDVLVFEDPENPKRSIYAGTTEDERFLLLYMSEGATSDNALSVKDLNAGDDAPIIPIITNFDNNYDVVDNIGDELLVITNKNAPRKRLIKINVNNPAEENWVELIPERAEVLNGVDFCGDKLIANYLQNAATNLYAFDTDGNEVGAIELPTIGTVGGFNSKKGEPIGFFTFTSFNYPATAFKYNAVENTTEVFRKSAVEFNSDDYVTTQKFFKSKDGASIPMFITHKKGVELNGKNPTLLYGYGGFNVNILPFFSLSNVPFLENGGVYAVATLRGGGELGEEWHKAGMLDQKQNVFNDFIAAAEYLIDQNYTSPDYLAINGGSNGGLLVGAATCQRPDLFRVALPAVGVMDMLRFHKFTIGHAWVVEYGSSENAEDFPNLYGYSPIHNLKKGTQYPATMVLTADHDDRVVPAHSFKYIATLQEMHTGPNPVVIRIETMAGHGAGKPTSKIIEESADKLAFLFYNMGITPTEL